MSTIVAFHQDDDGIWVADFDCGHAQHMRHDPPWQVRPWVLTEQGRAGFIGTTLDCVKCGPPAGPPEGGPYDRRTS